MGFVSLEKCPCAPCSSCPQPNLPVNIITPSRADTPLRSKLRAYRDASRASKSDLRGGCAQFKVPSRPRFWTPSPPRQAERGAPFPPRLMKTPYAVHPLPQRGEGVKSNRRQPRQGRQNIRAGGDHQGFFRPCRGSDVRRPSPHGSRRGLLSSAAPRLGATSASPPSTAYAVGYYLPPLRSWEQQRLLLPPRLTPWAIIFRRSAA